MICAFTVKELSLILVPLLTLMFIAGITILLWPKSTKQRTFLLCHKILQVGALLNLPKVDFKTLKRINRYLKIAVNASGSLAGDEFYELEGVCVKITECYNITSALRLTGKEDTLSEYKDILKKDIEDALGLLHDLNFIPDDVSNYKDDFFKRPKAVFSQRYKAEQAKKYLIGLKIGESEAKEQRDDI